MIGCDGLVLGGLDLGPLRVFDGGNPDRHAFLTEPVGFGKHLSDTFSASIGPGHAVKRFCPDTRFVDGQMSDGLVNRPALIFAGKWHQRRSLSETLPDPARPGGDFPKTLTLPILCPFPVNFINRSGRSGRSGLVEGDKVFRAGPRFEGLASLQNGLASLQRNVTESHKSAFVQIFFGVPNHP